ncbi:polysaccharide deacetylase [Bacillus coahuilensis p1.1.43]|uniref:Polysaccharide deacetylase n=1 Tax=Bacillus coahuilensis p1.1.43 TaxID=1150625 RepID=A0A147KAD2_9BACI|nr:polysaccharide deacetylase family protein [Bacillus coahuilensis]KUP07652.1 polysaccharide deacetylase [Bacillus coahuilensis p1.1.43]
MRKRAAILTSLLLLVGCQTDQETEQNTIIDEVEDRETEESIVEEPTESAEEKLDEVEPTEEVVQEPIEPQYKLNESNWSIEPISDANPQVVLLTIDDAPDQHALDMAKTLKAMNAPAIFFVNGHFLDTPEEKQILKEIYDLGFPIGNHTYSHSNLKDLSEEKQREEIISISDLVEEITGERPKFFRAPFGSNTEYSKSVVAEEKMLLMNWTYGYDWEKEYQTKEAIADIMVNTPYLNHGANLLMHDRTWTNEGLEDIVQGLRDKGYEMVDPNEIQTP